MRVPLGLRSRDEQKAAFSRMSYREFCDKANKDFWGTLASGSSVKDMSFRQFNDKLNKEFSAGYPSSTKDKLLTDKSIHMRHTVYGAEQPYDKFWFEGGQNKFSRDCAFSLDDELSDGGDVPIATGVFSKKIGVVDEEVGITKLEKELRPLLGDSFNMVDIPNAYNADQTYEQNRDRIMKDLRSLMKQPKYSFDRDKPLHQLEKEHKQLIKELTDMGESPDRIKRAEIVKKLEGVDKAIDSKDPSKFSD